MEQRTKEMAALLSQSLQSAGGDGTELSSTGPENGAPERRSGRV